MRSLEHIIWTSITIEQKKKIRCLSALETTEFEGHYQSVESAQEEFLF